MNKNQIYKVLISSSGFILLIFILLKIDTRKILEGLANINLISISPLFLLFIGLSYIKTQRWRLLLLNSKVNIIRKNLFSIYIGSFLPGAITPGRVGEIVKYKMLKDKEFDKNLGFALSVQDRIWDLSFTLSIGSLFLVYILNDKIFILFFLPCLIFFIYASMCPETIINYIGLVLSRIFPNFGFAKKITTLSEKVIPLSKKKLMQCTILTILSWLIYFFQVYLVFSATGIKYNFIFLSCVIASAGLVSLLPISIAGIGTRDLALIGLFSLSNKPAEAAVILSACILIIFLANCLISLPFWIYVSNSLATTNYDP